MRGLCERNVPTPNAFQIYSSIFVVVTTFDVLAMPVNEGPRACVVMCVRVHIFLVAVGEGGTCTSVRSFVVPFVELVRWLQWLIGRREWGLNCI